MNSRRASGAQGTISNGVLAGRAFGPEKDHMRGVELPPHGMGPRR